MKQRKCVRCGSWLTFDGPSGQYLSPWDPVHGFMCKADNTKFCDYEKGTPMQQSPTAPDVLIEKNPPPNWATIVIPELDVLQAEIAQWERRNFGEQPATNPLLGVVEEVGELCHGHLKMAQGIRGSATDHEAAIDDAVGDILIYLFNYCSRTGRKVSTCLAKAWYQVRSRDWLQSMPPCDVCGQPIPVADMVRVGERGLVHMRCAEAFLERTLKETVKPNQTK